MTGATFVHATSESGDNYYFSFDELLTDEAVRTEVDILLGDTDEDDYCIEHIARVEL